MENENAGPPQIADLARESFGKAVRLYRTENDWTQAELAAHLSRYGVSATQTTIAKIERGDRPTSIAEAAVIAAAFGIPVQSLLPLDRFSVALHNLGLMSTRFHVLLETKADLEKEVRANADDLANLLGEWDDYVQQMERDEVERLKGYDIDARHSAENGMRNKATGS